MRRVAQLTRAVRAARRGLGVELGRPWFGAARTREHRDVCEIEQRMPPAPGRQTAEGVGADQQDQRASVADLGAQTTQRVDRIRSPGAIEFARIEREARLTAQREFEQPHTRARAGDRRRPMRWYM